MTPLWSCTASVDREDLGPGASFLIADRPNRAE